MTHRERELLQRLHDAGVILTVDGDRLQYRAPAGALTPELRAALEELKPELVYEYHERAGILEYDARLPREEAESRARCDIFQRGARELTGVNMDGLPVALYRGQVAVMHFFHDPDCPGGHGRPDLCRCAVETRIQIVAGRPVPSGAS